MPRNQDNSRAVQEWLESDEGQRWSSLAHNPVSNRHDIHASDRHGGTGVFGELKADDNAAEYNSAGR